MKLDLYSDIYVGTEKKYIAFSALEMLGQKCGGVKRIKITVNIPDSIFEDGVDLYGSVEEVKEVDI